MRSLLMFGACFTSGTQSRSHLGSFARQHDSCSYPPTVLVTQGFPDTIRSGFVDDAEGGQGGILLRLYVALVPLVLVTALASVAHVQGIAPYSLGINPSNMSLGNTVTLTVTITGGARNTAYGVTVGVQKPNGTGSAVTNQFIFTDNRGGGNLVVQYPNTGSWTALN